MSILVVDDQAGMRMLLATLLEDAGYDVVEAAHGQAALTYLGAATELPGLILLDIAMPVMTGWAFLAELHRDERLASIPVMLMTALGPAAARSAPGPAVAYIEKPIDIDRLLSSVRAHYRLALPE